MKKITVLKTFGPGLRNLEIRRTRISAVVDWKELEDNGMVGVVFSVYYIRGETVGLCLLASIGNGK